MINEFKFPNGYLVQVCRKTDIIDSIEEDVDKDILLALITQIEEDANQFLIEGRWTGIPYLGNLRYSLHRRRFNQIGGQELLETAKQELDRNRYKAFRRELNVNVEEDLKRERFYKYMTANYVTKHRKVYTKMLKHPLNKDAKNKDVFARIMCNSFLDISNYIPFEYGTE